MTPLEFVAKEVGKQIWHNDPDRPFTDDTWNREVARWRHILEHEPRFISENMYANKCFKIARAALLALAEADLPREIEGRGLTPEDHTIFRAMLKAIASEANNG